VSRIVPDLSEDQLIQLRSGEEALVYKRCRDSFRCQLFVECVDCRLTAGESFFYRTLCGETAVPDFFNCIIYGGTGRQGLCLKNGSKRLTANPMPIKSSPVRIQAKKVHSAAK
jgi:hypothetical protein